MLLLPPLDSLRFFEAAARHQGYVAGGASGCSGVAAASLDGPPAPNAFTARTWNP